MIPLAVENGGYVGAAYVVFLLLLLIYVAIMAAKLQRIQREVDSLADLADRSQRTGHGPRRRARSAAARRRSRRCAKGGSRMSGLLALGVSHRTAPLALREQLALTEGRAAGVLNALVSEEPISEAVALSTCNRTELYLVATDSVEAETAGLGVLAREAGIRPTELLGPLYSLRGSEAARHLYRVTAGLESMIVGEAEIQGQVKRAYELALVEGAPGPILNRMFRGALAAGKRARTETAVGQKGVSIPSVAVELAQRNLGDLSERRVLLIGAGETSELTARALAARGSDAVFIANRGYNRAISLAQRFGGRAVRIDDLPAQLADADIVVSATNSPHHLIERSELALIMGEREGKPLLLIDLAVPRDIDPECREIEGVSLYDVDEVQAIVEQNASGPRGRGPAGERHPRLRADPLRALAGSSGGDADRRRPARARRLHRRPGPRRERDSLGEPLRHRSRADRADGARDRQSPAARAHREDQGNRRPR